MHVIHFMDQNKDETSPKPKKKSMKIFVMLKTLLQNPIYKSSKIKNITQYNQ